MGNSFKVLFRKFLSVPQMSLAIILLMIMGTARASSTCAPEVHVSTVDQLNQAVSNGDTCILVDPGIYELTERLVLKNVTLLGSSEGDVIFDVGDIPPKYDVPFLDCDGGITGVPFFGNTALIVAGETTIENIHFTGIKIGLDAYINNTNQPCEDGIVKNRYVIQSCTFEAKNSLGEDCTLDDLSLCVDYSVSLGNTNACGSCDADVDVVFANNSISGTVFGLFIVNEVSDKGATVQATITNNTVRSALTGFLVANPAGSGGVIHGSSEGNTFQGNLVGAFFGGGGDYSAGRGSSDCLVNWMSFKDKFVDSLIGLSVVGARRHVNSPDPLPPVQPSTGNRVEISFFAPEFAGNILRDADFFGSSSEQPRKNIQNPIGIPANQLEQGVWGPGNEVFLLAFQNPIFHEGVGRLIFRHHNNDFCLFEGCFPNFNLASSPPRLPDFGNRVHIEVSRKEFLNSIPLEEKPSTDLFR